jgi:PQQ-like domain
MRSIRGLAAVAGFTLAAGLAPAMATTTTASPGQWHGTFSAEKYEVTGNATAVSPNGKTVFAAGQALASLEATRDTGFGEIISYNAASGAVIWKDKFDPHPGVDDSGFSAIAVSPNGSTVFVSGYSGDANESAGLVQAVVAYNAATGKQLWQVIGEVHSGYVPNPIAVSPDSSTVFVSNPTVNGTGQTVAYNALTGKPLWTEAVGGEALALSANAATLYATGEPSDVGTVNGGTEAFNSSTGAVIWQTSESGAHITLPDAKLSPDGSTLFVSGAVEYSNSIVVAYSTSTGAKLWTAQTGAAGSTVGLGVTPGGSVIVSEGINAGPPSGGVSWVTLALNPATGKALWKNADDFKKNGPVAWAYAMSPNGSIAYITGWTRHPPKEFGDEYLTIGFSTTTGKPVWTAQYSGYPRNYGYAMAVSPNGSRIVVTGTGNIGPAVTDYDSMDTVAYSTG